MAGFYTKTAGGNTIRIIGDPEMLDETVDALGAVMDVAAKQYAAKPNPYQRIGESLVDIDGLNKILAILIDDYTVHRLNQDGSLIDVDLLNFKQWVSERYAS